MDFTNILSKALGIAKDKKFEVRFYKDGLLDDTKELTYLQLGTFLITNSEGINRLHIFLNSKSE